MVHWSLVFIGVVIGGIIGFGACALLSINGTEDEDDKRWLDQNRK